METEKVCVNLSAAELGAIDVLVAQGQYTSRSDLIRAGIRSVTEQHQASLHRATKSASCIGVMLIRKIDLEQLLQDGKRLSIFVVGILRIDDAVTPDLADQAIEHVQVLGSIRAPQAVLDRISDRFSRNLGAGSWL